MCECVFLFSWQTNVGHSLHGDLFVFVIGPCLTVYDDPHHCCCPSSSSCLFARAGANELVYYFILPILCWSGRDMAHTNEWVADGAVTFTLS